MQVYEDLTFRISLAFPSNYPYEPPLVKFESTCYRSLALLLSFNCTDDPSRPQRRSTRQHLPRYPQGKLIVSCDKAVLIVCIAGEMVACIECPNYSTLAPIFAWRFVFIASCARIQVLSVVSRTEQQLAAQCRSSRPMG